MKSKMLLLSVAVVAAGLFVLPATVSMFAGQHSWYDPKDQGIPCIKCHWLEYEEMRSGTYSLHKPHVYKNGTAHHFDCEECHNVTMNVDDYYHTGDVGEHTPAHAATTVSCLACHKSDLNATAMHELGSKYDMYSSASRDRCGKCHAIEENGMFYVRDPFIDHVDDELSNPRAAHRSFFLAMKNNSKDESQLSGANEACLGCHSRTGVNITWTRNQYVSYKVTCDKNGYNVSWNGTDDLGTNRTVFNSSSGWNW